MTLTAWIKISANPGDDGAIVAKLGPAGGSSRPAPTPECARRPSRSARTAPTRSRGTARPCSRLSTWYHVAGVYDAAARTLNIYVNGVLDNGVLSGTVPAAQSNSPANVNIAQRTGFPGQFNFLGTIDEVHVFNRALSAAEIQLDMNTPRVGP